MINIDKISPSHAVVVLGILDVGMAEIIRGCLDCDEFYDGYQACFDDNFKWGKKTERYYYSP